MLEYWPQIEEYDVEIIASDIDTAILERAAQGRYEARALNKLPTELRRKYFEILPNNTGFQLKTLIRQAIEFTQVNITDWSQMRGYRNFDIVFCRNLLIYFDDTSRRLAAEALFNAMRPGGFICLGHSESMSRISPLFTVRKFPEAIVYQKPIR